MNSALVVMQILHCRKDTRLLGTLYFAAPEQFGYGFSASTIKADIYAVGILLNMMLTGNCPKNRDLILRFCIVAHFQLNEINTALKLYEMKPLYAKDKRDACIIVAVNHRKYDLGDIDEMLENQGLMKLSKEIE